MKPHFLALLFTFGALMCEGQRLSEQYAPLIKETPHELLITQATDGDYLVYGDIHYYANSPSGSLVKVNATGERVAGFHVVSTDQPIERVVVLPSGEILIHGSFRYVNGTRSGHLVRLHLDGSVDDSFDVDANLDMWDFAVQSTGKVIIFSNDPVRRLNVDGSVDDTFISDPSVTSVLRGLVGQNDKIYAVAYSSIYRLDADGAVDDTYLFPDIPYSSIGPLALQADGKIVAVVRQKDSNPPYSQIQSFRRYNIDGTLDDSFTSEPVNSFVSSLAVRKDGKILFTGGMINFSGTEGNAFEINADGSFSRSLITTDFNGMSAVYEDRDENIFITGGFRKINRVLNQRYVAKIKADYQVDASFVLSVSRTPDDFHLSMAVQSTGKLIFGGGYFFSGLADVTSKLVRTFSDGTVDATFHPQIRTEESNYINPAVTAVAVQEDDRILVGGGSTLFDGASPALNRLLPDGAIDGSFQVGTGVKKSNGGSGNVSQIMIVNSKIYVLGYFDRYNGQECQSLVILDKDGKKIGPEQNAIPASSYLQHMEIQSDGKIVLLGSFPLSDTDNRKFIRLNADGSIDDSFQLKDVDGNLNDFDVYDGDSLVIVGNNVDFVSYRVLVKYGPNGELAAPFEQGTGFTARSNIFISASCVEWVAPGLIAVGGSFSGYNGIVSPGLVLLHTDGSAVPFSSPLDSTSFAMTAMCSNRVLYLTGGFSTGHGQTINSGAKLVFPIESTFADYDVHAIGSSTMAMTWSGRFEGAERITVERSTPDDQHYEAVATLPPGTQSYEATDLTELTPYYFRISGSNEFYSSDVFVGHDTTFIAPQLVFAPTDITPESFTAHWEYLPGTDSCLLQVSHDNFSTFLPGYEGLTLTEGTAQVQGLLPGEIYEYRVRRFRNGRASEFSEVMTVNLISGTEDAFAGVRVFPNPVRNHVVIDLAGENDHVRGEIRSLCGELVSTFSNSGSALFDLDAGGLKPGFFLLTLSDGNRRRSFRLVKIE